MLSSSRFFCLETVGARVVGLRGFNFGRFYVGTNINEGIFKEIINMYLFSSARFKNLSKEDMELH